MNVLLERRRRGVCLPELRLHRQSIPPERVVVRLGWTERKAWWRWGCDSRLIWRTDRRGIVLAWSRRGGNVAGRRRRHYGVRDGRKRWIEHEVRYRHELRVDVERWRRLVPERVVGHHPVLVIDYWVDVHRRWRRRRRGVEEVIMAPAGIYQRVSRRGESIALGRYLRPIEKANCRDGGSIRRQHVRSDPVSLTSVQIEDLDRHSRVLNDPMHQSLQAHFVDLGLDRLDAGGTVLIDRHGQIGLVSVGVELDPSARQELRELARQILGVR